MKLKFVCFMLFCILVSCQTDDRCREPMPETVVSEDTCMTRLRSGSNLGDLTTRVFQGIVADSTRCVFIIHNYLHSGDGIFSMSLLNTDKQLFTSEGTVYTLRGENDATLWQCVSRDGHQYHFLLDKDKNCIYWEKDGDDYGMSFVLHLVYDSFPKRKSL